MSQDNFFKRFFQRINIRKKSSSPIAASPMNDPMLEKLLRMVNDTDEKEISCDDVLDLLDQYVDLEARGENVAHLLPLVKKHLDRCRDCHEEYEALARIFAAS